LHFFLQVKLLTLSFLTFILFHRSVSNLFTTWALKCLLDKNCWVSYTSRMDCPPQIVSMYQSLLHCQIALAITMIAADKIICFFTILCIHSEQSFYYAILIFLEYWKIAGNVLHKAYGEMVGDWQYFHCTGYFVILAFTV
jgi:hypothetical protein